MSSVYTGVPANVSPSIAPTETIPADGDTRNVASVNPALQKLLDYIANIYNGTSSLGLSFVINLGNAPTSGFAWAFGGTTVVAGTNPGSGAVGQTRYLIAQAGTVRAVKILTTQLTAGGTVTITVLKNGVSSGATITLAAGTASGTLVSLATGMPFTVAAGDYLEIQSSNNAGVSAGIGLSMATILVTL